MNIIDKTNVYINSKARISGDNNNFIIQLKKPLLLKSNKTRFAAYITNLNFPYSFYSITSFNNTFTANLTNVMTSIVTTRSIVITPGNYTILTLIQELTSRLDSAFIIPVGLSGSYDKNSGRCTFILNNALNTLQLVFSSSDIIGEMLGFETRIFTNGVPQTGTKNVNVHIVNSFFIRSNIVTSNTDSESISTNNEPTDILACIPINVAPQQYIQYSMLQENAVYLNIGVIDYINFYLTNSRSKFIIDNHGLEFSFTLVILEVENFANIGFDTLQSITPQQTDEDLKKLEEQRNELVSQLQDMVNK